MNRSRIDAEALRDSMLAVAGKLNLEMGGPPVRMFYFKDDHSPVYDYSRFDPDSEGAHRRSIYRFIVRSVPDPSWSVWIVPIRLYLHPSAPPSPRYRLWLC